MARRLIERMTLAGHAPEAHFLEGEGHLLTPEASNGAWALMLAFSRRHLAPATSGAAPTGT